MKLQDIEKKYGFEFPLLYKQLEADGMLNVGEYGSNWSSEVYPKLKENPSLLLYSYDFELLNLDGVNEEIKQLRDPEDYRKIRKEFKFIPFAQSYGGDHYCFFLNEEKDGEMPIVFLSHDTIEADYLAKNLQDFIFKKFLTDMAYFDNEDVSDQELKNNLESMFKTHKKYLTHQQQGILQNILNREIINYEISFSYGNEEAKGLLTNDEKNNLLNEIIPFDKMGTSFEYSDEE
ncbi:SMI1/KNR4 family protein [Flavobacterium sp. 3-210]